MKVDVQSHAGTTMMIMSFIAAVFVLDLLTPLGIPYWLLYGIPFFFIRYNTPRNFAFILAGTCSVLIFVGYLLSPGERAEPLTHRASAALILWSVAIILARQRL